MYVNKCIKCGREFETKNPKRVICPDCLYPDKSMMLTSESKTEAEKPEQLNGYSAGGNDETPRYYSTGGDTERPNRQRPYNNQNNRNRQGGYQNHLGYNRNNNRNRGFQKNQSNRNSGFKHQGGFNNKKHSAINKKAPKTLLVSREQLEQIEALYKALLPLPNPDCHEVIGEKIGLEPRKVFFGINLIRQKMMLPKLPFPKRKLAISPDQLFAIKNLYEPLLPLPPFGCHKIIAAQLKMDEWRVHVGIGLIRSQLGLERWNENRTDIPEELRKRIVKSDESDKPKSKKTKKSDEETVNE